MEFTALETRKSKRTIPTCIVEASRQVTLRSLLIFARDCRWLFGRGFLAKTGEDVLRKGLVSIEDR